MGNLTSLFKRKASSLPDFSEKQAALRPHLAGMAPKEKLQTLIAVSKVWTYDYDERKGFMLELFELLSQETQASLLDFLADHIPGRDISEDIPLALSQIKKEKLEEFAAIPIKQKPLER